MYHSVTTHSEKPNCQNFHVWNSHGQGGHMPIVIPDATFLVIRFCSYTICHMQYDRRSWRQLCFLYFVF